MSQEEIESKIDRMSEDIEILKRTVEKLMDSVRILNHDLTQFMHNTQRAIDRVDSDARSSAFQYAMDKFGRF